MSLSLRTLTVSSVYQNSSVKPVSAIRVQGKWLENIGFCVGCKVEIYESDGEITIKLVQSEEDSIKLAKNTENAIKSAEITENGGSDNGDKSNGCRKCKNKGSKA